MPSITANTSANVTSITVTGNTLMGTNCIVVANAISNTTGISTTLGTILSQPDGPYTISNNVATDLYLVTVSATLLPNTWSNTTIVAPVLYNIITTSGFTANQMAPLLINSATDPNVNTMTIITNGGPPGQPSTVLDAAYSIYPGPINISTNIPALVPYNINISMSAIITVFANSAVTVPTSNTSNSHTTAITLNDYAATNPAIIQREAGRNDANVTFNGTYTGIAPASIWIQISDFNTHATLQAYQNTGGFVTAGSTSSGTWQGSVPVSVAANMVYATAGVNSSAPSLVSGNTATPFGVGSIFVLLGDGLMASYASKFVGSGDPATTTLGRQWCTSYNSLNGGSVVCNLGGVMASNGWSNTTSANTASGYRSFLSIVQPQVQWPVAIFNSSQINSGLNPGTANANLSWLNTSTANTCVWGNFLQNLSLAGVVDFEGVLWYQGIADSQLGANVTITSNSIQQLYTNILGLTDRTPSQLPMFISILGPDYTSSNDANMSTFRSALQQVVATSNSNYNLVLSSSSVDLIPDVDGVTPTALDYRHIGFRDGQTIGAYFGANNIPGSGPSIYNATSSGNNILLNCVLNGVSGIRGNVPLDGFIIVDSGGATPLNYSFIQPNQINIAMNKALGTTTTIGYLQGANTLTYGTNLVYSITTASGDTVGFPLLPTLNSNSITVSTQTTATAYINTAALLNGVLFKGASIGAPSNGAIMAVLANVPNGVFAMTINGTARNIGPISFATNTTCGQVASVISNVMKQYGCNCTYDNTFTLASRSIQYSFVLVSQGYGSSYTLSYATTGTGGLDISKVLGWDSANATLLLPGNNYIASEATGNNFGYYVDPVTSWNPASRFTEQRIGVWQNIQGIPFLTFFCRDTASTTGTLGRFTVIYEVGAFPGNTSQLTAPQNVGPYQANVVQNGTVVYSNTVPYHLYWGRWREIPSTRPVTVSSSTLLAQNLIPHYTTAATTPINWQFSTPLPPAVVTPPFVTGTNDTFTGIEVEGGQPGDRADIGPLNDWTVDWIYYNTGISDNSAANLLPTILAQAEVLGYFGGAIIRDSKTNAPVNLLDPTLGPTYTKTTYAGYNDGTPWLQPATNSFGATLDNGHMPSLNYIPSLLTGDSYYVENLQFQVNEEYISESNFFNTENEPRARAWPLRDAIHATLVTPVTTPSFMLPNSYAQTYYTQFSNALVTNFYDSTRTDQTTFGLPGYATNLMDFWQSGYTAIIWAYGAILGMANMANLTSWICTKHFLPRLQPSNAHSLFYCTIDNGAGAPGNLMTVLEIPKGSSLEQNAGNSFPGNGVISIGKTVLYGNGNISCWSTVTGLGTGSGGLGTYYLANTTLQANTLAVTTDGYIRALQSFEQFGCAWTPRTQPSYGGSPPFYPTWAIATASNFLINNYNGSAGPTGWSNYFDPNTIYTANAPDGSITYVAITYAAIAQMVHAGFLSATGPEYTWYTSSNGFPGVISSGAGIDFKWRIIP